MKVHSQQRWYELPAHKLTDAKSSARPAKGEVPTAGLMAHLVFMRLGRRCSSVQLQPCALARPSAFVFWKNAQLLHVLLPIHQTVLHLRSLALLSLHLAARLLARWAEHSIENYSVCQRTKAVGKRYEIRPVLPRWPQPASPLLPIPCGCCAATRRHWHAMLILGTLLCRATTLLPASKSQYCTLASWRLRYPSATARSPASTSRTAAS